LLAHQQRQQEEREKAGGAWHHIDVLFATELGDYTHPDNFGRALRNLVAWSDPAQFSITRCLDLPVKARTKLETIIRAHEKLPALRPHDLRHTVAILMRRGVPAEVVSRILGHSKVSVTLDIYRHVLESEKQMTMPDLFDAPLPVRELPRVTLN
jgi:integrase